MPWIHADDLVGIYLAAIDGADWTGPVNATAPEPVTNGDFSHALGRALRRPAVLPIPGAALGLLYGDMAEIVTTGQRAVPKRPLALGYEFRHPDLDEALKDAVG
jgi:NAD dependent epimerase/dehydratase family enzyme